MTPTFNPELDLSITRIIKAPRAALWRAWTVAEELEKWWIPEPMILKMVEMDVRPGGAMVSIMSGNGRDFTPHLTGCYLAVEPLERLVFTNSLTAGWRPAERPFMTTVITFEDHDEGTALTGHVMHRDKEMRDKHHSMGWNEGWGAVLDQLARRVQDRPG